MKGTKRRSVRRKAHASSQGRAQRKTAGPLPRIDDYVGDKILRLGNLVGRSATIKYRRLVGLPQMSWRIVALLGAQPPMTLLELAERAALDKGQVSNGVSDLVRRKLVSRRPNPDDGRAVDLELTERGIGVYAIILNGAFQRNEQLLAGIPARRRRMLLSFLDLLIARARIMLEEEEVKAKSRSRPA